MRKLWFQLHWLLGISAGTVLAVVGFTGGLLSFEEEVLRALNPGVLTVPLRAEAPPSPLDLLVAVQRQNPARAVTALTVPAAAGHAARVTFAPVAGGGRGEARPVDPHTGALLGAVQHGEVFRQIRQLHRWLAVGDIGRQIVGASTVALVILAASGLYLRWPRRVFRWRSWFRIDLSRRGRGLWRNLHAVVGTWVLVPYLVMGLTGLWWSYPWYRDTLMAAAGAERGGDRPGGAAGPAAATEPVVLDGPLLWAAFLQAAPRHGQVTLRPPLRAGQPFQITYLDRDPPHERASNTLVLDALTGAVRAHRRHADLPLGQRLVAAIFPLHSGSAFGRGGLVAFMLASFLMPLFAVTGWMLYLDRRRRKRAPRQHQPRATALASADPAE